MGKGFRKVPLGLHDFFQSGKVNILQQRGEENVRNIEVF